MATTGQSEEIGDLDKKLFRALNLHRSEFQVERRTQHMTCRKHSLYHMTHKMSRLLNLPRVRFEATSLRCSHPASVFPGCQVMHAFPAATSDTLACRPLFRAPGGICFPKDPRGQNLQMRYAPTADHGCQNLGKEGPCLSAVSKKDGLINEAHGHQHTNSMTRSFRCGRNITRDVKR